MRCYFPFRVGFDVSRPKVDLLSPLSITFPGRQHHLQTLSSRIMPQKQRRYTATGKPPRLSSSELVCKSLDHDDTDMLIDKWLEHRNDAYWDWFRGVRERKHDLNGKDRQLLVWSKGDFVPENIFCRTVDSGRLIPLDRTWTTHVYHHRSMMERKLSMMPVVSSSACVWHMRSN